MEYMKKMAKTPAIGNTYNEPCTEAQIQSMEQEIGKQFPKAYREFLQLGGNRANMIADMAANSFIGDEPYWKERQQHCREGMAEAGFSLQKDFWVFGYLDSDQFHFFYFDEGDDPPVYWYCSYFPDEKGNDYAGVKETKDTFIEHINRQIDEVKKNGY